MSEMNDSEIKEYLEKWREISGPLEKLTGIQRIAFDPGVMFIYERKTVSIPRWLLELINTGLANLEAELPDWATGKLAIVFDGPPSHRSGRFVGVELDGKEIGFGEWERNGKRWELILPDPYTRLARLESDLYQALTREKRLQSALVEAGLEIKEPWHNNGRD